MRYYEKKGIIPFSPLTGRRYRVGSLAFEKGILRPFFASY